MSRYPNEEFGGQGGSAKRCRHTILVIDDEADMRMLIAMVLESCGYRVIAHGDGRQAISTLMETPVDLVVTDLFMPEFDGLEVIRTIRDCCDHLPIVAISGGSAYVTFDCLPIARLLGADSVLCKPFALKELEQEVRALLPA